MGFPYRPAPSLLFRCQRPLEMLLFCLRCPCLDFGWPGQVLDLMYTSVTVELEGAVMPFTVE